MSDAKNVIVVLSGTSYNGQPGDERKVTAEKADWLEQHGLAVRKSTAKAAESGNA